MILNAQNISFSYEESLKPSLENISFSIPEGHLTCLCGKNGSGKSTLLTLLCGIHTPQEGSLFIADLDLPKEINWLRGQVALVPQDPDLYILGTTVEEDLFLSIPKTDTIGKEKALHYTEKFNLSPKLSLPVHQLSFGEKRKLCIASALSGISGKALKLLLLDEPFAGLDYPSALVMSDLIKNNKKEGLTQIVVTHDLEYLIDFTDQIIILQDGQIFFDGTPESAKDYYLTAGIRPPYVYPQNV